MSKLGDLVSAADELAVGFEPAGGSELGGNGGGRRWHDERTAALEVDSSVGWQTLIEGGRDSVEYLLDLLPLDQQFYRVYNIQPPSEVEIERSPWRDITKEQLFQLIENLRAEANNDEEFYQLFAAIRRHSDLFEGEARTWFHKFEDEVDDCFWGDYTAQERRGLPIEDGPDADNLDHTREIIERWFGEDFGGVGPWRHQYGFFRRVLGRILDKRSKHDGPPGFQDTAGDYGLGLYQDIIDAISPYFIELIRKNRKVGLIGVMCGGGEIEARLARIAKERGVTIPAALVDMNGPALDIAEPLVCNALGDSDNTEGLVHRAQERIGGESLNHGTELFLKEQNIDHVLATGIYGPNYLRFEDIIALLARLENIADNARQSNDSPPIPVTVEIVALDNDAIDAAEKKRLGQELLRRKLKEAMALAFKEKTNWSEKKEQFREVREVLRAITSIVGAHPKWDPSREKNVAQMFREMVRATGLEKRLSERGLPSVGRAKTEIPRGERSDPTRTGYYSQINYGEQVQAMKFSTKRELELLLEPFGYKIQEIGKALFGQTIILQITHAQE